MVFYDLLSETAGLLESQNYTVNCSFQWEERMIRVNKDYLVRIFDNIASNLTRYADWAYPVQLETVYEREYAGVRVSNRSAKEETKEQGTHIGLHNIKKMMEWLQYISKNLIFATDTGNSKCKGEKRGW